MEPLLTAVKERQARPAHHAQSDEQDAPMAMFLAGGVRALIYTLKGFVRKRAFLTLGKRTTRTTNVASPSQEARVTRRVQPRVQLLLKNVALGTSVFGTYEYICNHFLLNNTNQHPDHSNGTPLFGHFVAGACAGLAQVMVTTTWEITSQLPWHGKKWNRTMDTKFLFRRTIHHTVGYASLFGCFEMFRRMALQQFHHILQNGAEWVPILFDEMERHGLILPPEPSQQVNITPVTLTAAFLAGGLAGQVHFAVSHYTSHWKLQSIPKSIEKHSTPKSPIVGGLLTRLPPPPTLRSTMGAFGPAALCFVAFQYGGELAARMVV